MPKLSLLPLFLLPTMLAAACSPLGIFNSVQSGGLKPDVADMPYGDHPRQRLDLYLPESTGEPAPLLVWFYGGAWDSGDKGNYAFVARRFTDMGYAVAIPDYRLVPEVRFPAFVEDAAVALARLVVYAEENPALLRPDSVLLAGHSAGAYIAVQVVADPAYLAAEQLSSKRVAGIIGLSGPYDFHPYVVKASQAAFGDAPASASQPVAQNLAHMPPLLLITGDSDTTVQPKNSVRLAAAAPQAQLVQVAGAGHVGVLLGLGTRLTGNETVLQPIDAFMRDRAPGRAATAQTTAFLSPRGGGMPAPEPTGRRSR
jgi:acetyl esterase/lipase